MILLFRKHFKTLQDLRENSDRICLMRGKRVGERKMSHLNIF